MLDSHTMEDTPAAPEEGLGRAPRMPVSVAPVPLACTSQVLTTRGGSLSKLPLRQLGPSVLEIGIHRASESLPAMGYGSDPIELSSTGGHSPAGWFKHVGNHE